MSKICSFFGNSTIWNEQDISEKVNSEITRLVNNEQVDTFYVGTKGAFELLTYKTLVRLKQSYPHLKIWLVIAYMEDLHNCIYPFDEFFYPPMSELGYKRWSISNRNEWIIENTDYIIACNQYEGRAFKFCQKAIRKGKTVIEIGENP